MGAPLIIDKHELRSLFGRDFSVENPDSNILASIFQTTGEPIKTKMVDGKEVLVEPITDKGVIHEFSRRAFELS
jgi:hypothetical protein